MESQLIFWCLLIGLLGILAQVCVKITQLKSRAKAANTSFEISSYIKDDWTTILLSFLFLVACLIAQDEILKIRPEIQSKIKIAYFFVGYAGSSIFNAIWNRTEKKIMSVIDEKTNIADGVLPTEKA